MSAEYYYQVCSKAVGEIVELETVDGSAYHAIIEDVDKNYLYLSSIGTLAKLIMEHEHVEKKDLEETLVAIPLVSIVSFTFVPFMYY